ncbi:ABC transporter ATP-binding protein [Streptomyces sp. NPDC059883]|uniref:ABC transporter ATP-binding protein n=1 Tax=unclassified Streptomyces TaxID=2593676 RepID=UPI003648F8B4
MSPLADPGTPSVAATAPADPVLTVDGLDVTVTGGAHAVRGVSFTLGRGEAVGLVGESGSGKSLTCRSALGVLPAGCSVSGGRITLGATGSEPAADLTAFTRKQWNAVRGSRIGAVFQDPASYLNPSLTVGRQLTEQLRVGGALSRTDARTRAVELFAAVGLHRPEEVFHQYPHELSGGMLQRVLIAVAVSCAPELLIADEATTALDVVIQAEILELLQRLRTEQGLSLLLVTHDLAVVAESCDRILVMYAGEIVEDGPTAEVLAAPAHPYTEALLRVASIGAWGRRELDIIPGRPPETGAALPGCRFADRCAHAVARCTEGPVDLHTLDDGRRARCLRPAGLLDEESQTRPGGAASDHVPVPAAASVSSASAVASASAVSSAPVPASEPVSEGAST